MTMDAVICTALADAQKISNAVDVKLGYPKPGVDIGGGVHAPPSQSVTLRHAPIVKHPTLTQWAYETPDKTATDALAVVKVESVDPTVKTVSVITLDASWATAAIVAVAVAEPVAQEVKL